MRSSICREYGPPSSLGMVDLPDPTPGPGQAVVEVAYAAVNFPDVLIIANKYQVSIPLPFVPGSEFSGTVSALGVGGDAGPIRVGDRVFGSVMNGAFADKVVVDVGSLHRLPEQVRLDQAAAFWVTHATAYHSLRSVAEVTAGERVLVLGAAGGVGLAAVTLARQLGAEVFAAASTDEKLEVCQRAGATALLNYGSTDLRTALKEIAPDGVDVVIDPVGGPLAEKALRALRWKGRFVTVGYASGEIPRIPLNLVLLKGCIVKGFEVRTFSHFEPILADRDQRELLELLAKGVIDPHISSIHELDELPDALDEIAGRRSTGKVLVRMKDVR